MQTIDSDRKLKTLVENCTCSVCQDLFENPVTIRCRHTFCRKCHEKLVKKLGQNTPVIQISGLFGLPMPAVQPSSVIQCPICRALFLPDDPVEPSQTIQSQLDELKKIKSERCQADDCWKVVADAQWSDKRLCCDHHHEHLDTLQQTSDELIEEISLALSQDKTLTKELDEKRSKIPELKRILQEKLEKRFDEYERQLLATKEAVEQECIGRNDKMNELRSDLARLKQLKQSNDLHGLETIMDAMKTSLAKCRRECPPLKIAYSFEQDQLQRNFDEVLCSVQASLHTRPYDSLSSEQKAKTVLNTHDKQPWDMEILTNLSGMVIVDRQLKYKANHPDGETIDGPLLVVNFKSFPTGKLHLTNLDGKELGSIHLKFEEVGMPGRFCICNERQLIFASDAGRHKVIVTDLEGKVLKTFGSIGNSNSEFNEPLGLCCRGGILYVADTSNRRIQMFDIDNNYCHVGTIRHDDFQRVCDVAVTASVIAVLDQENRRIHVFDKQTRRFQRHQTVPGTVFGLTSDRYGDLIVTVPSEDKVVIYDSECMECMKQLSIEQSGDEDESTETDINALFNRMMTMQMRPPKLYHGLAMDSGTRRLFVADTGRRQILVVDL